MNSGDPTVPTASQVAALLDSLQDAFGLDTRADRYELVDHWTRDRSGTAFYRMIGKPSGLELLVKTGAAWDQGQAEHLHAAMVDLADTISSADIDGAHAIRPQAWTGAPPLVVMPFVEGTDLVTLLRAPNREEWAHIGRWIRMAGGMLAAYHSSHPTPPSADMAPAGDEVRDAGRRMRLPAQLMDHVLNEIDWRRRCALSFGDFGPGNLLGTAEGDVYLLDPPDHPSIALIHKDIGNFMFEMRRQLAGHGYTRTRPVRGRFHELRAGFLEGYSEWSGRAIDSCDEGLIAIFEIRRASGMARKRFPTRLPDSAWFARSALARRREVVRADCGHS